MRAYEIPVVMPFRLDLTVSVLRRLSTNLVDVLTPEGAYVRALPGVREPMIVRATQRAGQRSLSVTIEGDGCNDAAVVALVRRTLGADRELRSFHRGAAQVAWLAPLVRRMRGVKPPRYPSLWEACANAIVFQQLSIRAASAIMNRLTVAVGRSLRTNGIPVPLYLFPAAENFQHASHGLLRTTGLSAGKIATLQRVCESISSGVLDATVLEQCTSMEAATILQEIKGIGPWTAAVILLRGFGRLDVFPANDTSIASNITLVAGSARFDVKRTLDAVGAQRGMLYFHLLLGRLEARGEIGRPSFDGNPPDMALDRVRPATSRSRLT